LLFAAAARDGIRTHGCLATSTVFALSYRDVEELLAGRGVEADHPTIYRWVQRFTPLLADAARLCRHPVGSRWQVDETYVKVGRYVYRAVDEFGQVIDVFVSPRRDASAARRFFQQAITTTKVQPVEVITDRAATLTCAAEVTLATRVATAQLNAHARPWVWGRPPPSPAPSDGPSSIGF